MHNGLWYFIDEGLTNKEIGSINKQSIAAIINKLSTSATYELWHQRLVHPGQTTMQEIHQYVKGVPQLKGNAFHRCLSCTLSKMSRQIDQKAKQTGITTEDMIHNIDDWNGEYIQEQCKTCIQCPPFNTEEPDSTSEILDIRPDSIIKRSSSTPHQISHSKAHKRTN